MVDIFGTLGPACAKEEVLKKMFAEGMTGMRLNLSHMMLSDNEDKIRLIRRAAEMAGKEAKILVDLQGPELRIGNLPEALALEAGDELLLRGSLEKRDSGLRIESSEGSLGLREGVPGSDSADLADPAGDTEDCSGRKVIPLDQRILAMLPVGAEFLMDDGKILARVLEVRDDCVTAEVLRGGTLSSRKSITVPGGTDGLPALTEADRINLKTAARVGVTGVMQPFVRSSRDLEELRAALREAGGESIRIYAKIENMTGVKMIDELIDACDEIVIARGDLGNAMPLWELPGVQKRIARKCRDKGRDFMVVTQMLSSMEHAAVPTRAEVSDIYNAVMDGAASVMVTGETAVGEYPAEVIRYLTRTAAEAERQAEEKDE